MGHLNDYRAIHHRRLFDYKRRVEYSYSGGQVITTSQKEGSHFSLGTDNQL